MRPGLRLEFPLQCLPGDARRVALTFDDGPNPEATPRVLDALATLGVHATFFVLGKHAVRWPHLVRRVRDEGHVLGNHGFFHRKLHLAGPRRVHTDLVLGTRSIEWAGGAKPRYYRAPHGYLNPWVLRSAQRLGQRTVDWTLGVWDSAIRDPEEIVRRVVEGVRPGTIVLLHDGDGYNPHGDRLATAAALPMIVGELRERDYQFALLETGG